MTRSDVESATILRCEVGSTGHGLGTGSDDRDEMGVCVEPLVEAVGLSAPFEQYIFRTATERTGKHDAPSQAGDVDLTIYSLRKFLRLALKGNPTVLTLLFATPLQADARGYMLQEMAGDIVSRAAGGAYLGYLQAQRQRLTGERGQKRSKRQDLVEQHGFDTKYATHMLRLGFQGIELLTTGRLRFPMIDPALTFLRAVRAGQHGLDHCLTRAGELEAQIKDLLDTSPLPATPNMDAVETWMTRIYFRQWSAQRAVQDAIEDALSC